MSAARLPRPKEINNTAELQSISFSKILSKDISEIGRLTLACEVFGVFYLDLTDRTCSKMIDDLHQLQQIMTGWFSQPTEKKIKETENVSMPMGQ